MHFLYSETAPASIPIVRESDPIPELEPEVELIPEPGLMVKPGPLNAEPRPMHPTPTKCKWTHCEV